MYNNNNRCSFLHKVALPFFKMTTAHRATFHPAIGHANQGGYRSISTRHQYGKNLLPSHTTLKYRQNGQATTEEIQQRDLRKELFEREQKIHGLPQTGGEGIKQLQTAEVEDVQEQQRRQLPNIENVSSDSSWTKSIGPAHTASILDSVDLSAYDDSDAVFDNKKNKDKEKTSSTIRIKREDEVEDGDDDEDEEALLHELDIIKREKEEEQKRELEELAAEAKRREQQRLIHSNPVFNNAQFGVKRRWDEDTIFGQTRQDDVSSKNSKRFINDTIRSDFHRSFLRRYIQ